MLTRDQPIEEVNKYYFAYGSNIHLSQMARRCPSSTFIGKAILPGFRWQINTRGVANVVESSDHVVEGLLYDVSCQDERVLDRSEGVSKGFYQKQFLSVDFESHKYAPYKTAYVARILEREKAALSGPLLDDTVPAKVDVEDLYGNAQYPDKLMVGPSSSNSQMNPGPISQEGDAMQVDSISQQPQVEYEMSIEDTPTASESPEATQVHRVQNNRATALVYVSRNFDQDGEIREEYIHRMAQAIDDAAYLGVSTDYIDTWIRPLLHSPSVREDTSHIQSRLDHAETSAAELWMTNRQENDPQNTDLDMVHSGGMQAAESY